MWPDENDRADSATAVRALARMGESHPKSAESFFGVRTDSQAYAFSALTILTIAGTSDLFAFTDDGCVRSCSRRKGVPSSAP
jgi:hypothetical protein